MVAFHTTRLVATPLRSARSCATVSQFYARREVARAKRCSHRGLNRHRLGYRQGNDREGLPHFRQRAQASLRRASAPVRGLRYEGCRGIRGAGSSKALDPPRRMIREL
jgi:hypothetical protein